MKYFVHQVQIRSDFSRFCPGISACHAGKYLSLLSNCVLNTAVFLVFCVTLKCYYMSRDGEKFTIKLKVTRQICEKCGFGCVESLKD